MKTPLPSIGQVYSILLQEESQREIHSGTQFVAESASFHVNSSRMPTSQFVRRPGFDLKKTNLICNYCKKPGHIVDKCYKLHGFPADFKFTKSKRPSLAAQAEISTTGDSSNVISAAVPVNQNSTDTPNVHITPEMYSQLVEEFTGLL